MKILDSIKSGINEQYKVYANHAVTITFVAKDDQTNVKSIHNTTVNLLTSDCLPSMIQAKVTDAITAKLLQLNS